jgi:hypothetical protein
VTFGFNLILGLFILAPGLAVFAGLYHGSQLGLVNSPPPPPGSNLALVIVTAGALVAHFIGALVFLTQDLACSHGWPCLRVAFEPNLYATLFSMAQTRASVTGAQAASVLGALIVLTGASFVTTRQIVATSTTSKALKNVLYGWLSEIAVAGINEAVLAYVLSDVQDNGTIVGYEGAVANMTINADKEVTSILLTSCETFYLRVTAAGVVRRKALQTSTIPQLYLDQSRIKNIAFERVRFGGID